GCVRSKGYLWMASRHDLAGMWSIAGQNLGLEPMGFWEAAILRDAEEERAEKGHHHLPDGIRRVDWDATWGDRRQELVFIGVGLDREAITAALDACLLTDEEMAMGPAGWSAFSDPFPPWPVEVVEGEEEEDDDEAPEPWRG
ncbi:MAG: cobalamin biosynthesis protein CobW, partial [Gemmatimonadetes bacterium]|nr:cobalamin biosynthesis protein CobW [Gemmatimonadota bacterium]